MARQRQNQPDLWVEPPRFQHRLRRKGVEPQSAAGIKIGHVLFDEIFDGFLQTLLQNQKIIACNLPMAGKTTD